MADYTPHEATDGSLQETIDSLVLLKQAVIADRDYNAATSESGDYTDEDWDAVEIYLTKINTVIIAIKDILPIVP